MFNSPGLYSTNLLLKSTPSPFSLFLLLIFLFSYLSSCFLEFPSNYFWLEYFGILLDRENHAFGKNIAEDGFIFVPTEFQLPLPEISDKKSKEKKVAKKSSTPTKTSAQFPIFDTFVFQYKGDGQDPNLAALLRQNFTELHTHLSALIHKKMEFLELPAEFQLDIFRVVPHLAAHVAEEKPDKILEFPKSVLKFLNSLHSDSTSDQWHSTIIGAAVYSVVQYIIVLFSSSTFSANLFPRLINFITDEFLPKITTLYLTLFTPSTPPSPPHSPHTLYSLSCVFGLLFEILRTISTWKNYEEISAKIFMSVFSVALENRHKFLEKIIGL